MGGSATVRDGYELNVWFLFFDIMTDTICYSDFILDTQKQWK